MIYTLEQYGGGIGAANNSPAWCRMLKAIVAAADNNGIIQLGAGTYRFTWQPDAINLVDAQNISIVGGGRRISRLFFDQCGGIRILYSLSNWCAAHLEDFGILTNATNQYTGLSLNFAEPPPPNSIPSPYATSDLIRLSIGGEMQAQFSTGIAVSGVSNISYQDIEIYGDASGTLFGDVAAGYGGVGVGIQLDGGAGISVGHNFRNLNASQIGVGLVFGRAVQGVTITSGSTFTGNNIGILVPVTAGGNDEQSQLSLSNAQFACYSWGIYAPGNIYNMSVQGCLFYMVNTGSGILNGGNASNIIGNTFTALAPNNNGIIVPSTGVNCLAMANFCFRTTTGIWFQQGASNCFAIGNSCVVRDDNVGVGTTASTNILASNSAASTSL